MAMAGPTKAQMVFLCMDNQQLKQPTELCIYLADQDIYTPIHLVFIIMSLFFQSLTLV